MAQIREFEPQKLVVGIIYSNLTVLNEVMDILTAEFGPVDCESEIFSFSKEYSTYYDGELGGEGMRKIISFDRTVDPSRQAKIKEFTNEIENRFSKNGGRLINLDPGLMSHGCFVLATTKPTGFRIPLENGIYSELTLFYARGDWRKLPWTYRDYQSEKVQSFLTKVRKKYLSQRKALKSN